MERLTAKASNGMAYLVKVRPDEQDVDSPYPDTLRCILESFKRLAEYEDTGLYPEEIVNLNTFEGSQIEKLLYKISALENDLEYWHREAINQASQAVEMRIADAWILCSEGLPEVTINPITNDYQKYNITFKSEMNGIEIYDTRQYSYGVASGGDHWLHEGQIMDKYVTAWQPLPEPYKGEE